MNRRRWFWLIGAVAVVVVVGLFVFNRSRTNTAAAQEAAQGEVVTAFMGDLSASATASGQVFAQRKAALVLAQTGQVVDVPITVGDVVQAGETLLQLETAALERAVRNAEQTVVIQENNLDKLLAPPDEQDWLVAQASLLNAQAQLDALRDGPTAEQIAASEANMRASNANVTAAAARLAQAQEGGTPAQVLEAQNALADAQTRYTQAEEQHRATFDCEFDSGTGEWLCEGGTEAEEAARVPAIQALAELRAAEERLELLRPGGNANNIASAQASLSAAVANRDAAQARHELLLAGATEAQIAASEAALAQAESQVTRLDEGPTEEQIIIAEAQVEQARLALAQAQNDLAEATLTAPFEGLVTAVHFTVGELASGVAVELIDINSLEVVLEVDEIDISDLSVGQPATIIIESFSDSSLESEIIAIAPKNKLGTGSGLVTYEVNLRLPSTDLDVRENMTANASLITAEREAVLLVSSRAIRADREAGTYSVQLVRGEEVVPTEITIGLRDGRYTQVTSGLNEGDELLIGDLDVPRVNFGPPGE